MSQEDLRARFEDLAFGLMAEASGQLLLVDWQVAASVAINGQLHCNDWLPEINSWLRSEFGQSGGSLWSMGIRLLTPRSLPEEWYEEDTMLGDYLRSIREYQQDTSGKLDLGRYVEADSAEEPLIAACQIDADQRRDLLRESAMMGVKLLTGNEGTP